MGRKRANGEGSIYKTKDGRWRAVIDLGSGADGKRRRRSKVAHRRADAVAFLQSLQSDKSNGVAAITGTPKLAAYLDHWLAGLATRSAANTIALYRNAVKQHIGPHIGGVRIDKVTPVQLVALLNTWQSAGVGVRTQQVGLAVLSHALEEAAGLGIIRTNPASNVKPPRGERKGIDPFTPAEVLAIINAATDHPYHHAGIVLLFACGLRFGEMAGLPRRCVDLKAGSIRIEQQAATDAATGKTIIAAPKTKRSKRTIDLTPMAATAMTEHLARSVALGRAGDDLVFLGARGGILRHSTWLARVWNPVLRAAEVRQRPPHHARHTYATLSLSAGVPIHVVSAVLGHSRASVTLDTYAHYLPAQQQSATAAIERLIG